MHLETVDSIGFCEGLARVPRAGFVLTTRKPTKMPTYAATSFGLGFDADTIQKDITIVLVLEIVM